LRNFQNILRTDPRLRFVKEYNFVLKVCKYNKKSSQDYFQPKTERVKTKSIHRRPQKNIILTKESVNLSFPAGSIFCKYLTNENVLHGPNCQLLPCYLSFK